MSLDVVIDGKIRIKYASMKNVGAGISQILVYFLSLGQKQECRI